MALLCPDTGEAYILGVILGQEDVPADLNFHLYTNNVSPAEGSTLGSFTELSALLYTVLTVDVSTLEITTVAGVTAATTDASDIAIGGSCTIYGYFCTEESDTHLLWAELFTGGPFTFPSGGGTLRFTPRVELD